MESAGGRPFLIVRVKDTSEGEGLYEFGSRHYRELLEEARRNPQANYRQGRPDDVPDHIFKMRYEWQNASADCVYQVEEDIFLSWRTREYGFIIATGICEEDLAMYGQQRGKILSSFEEVR